MRGSRSTGLKLISSRNRSTWFTVVCLLHSRLRPWRRRCAATRWKTISADRRKEQQNQVDIRGVLLTGGNKAGDSFLFGGRLGG